MDCERDILRRLAQHGVLDVPEVAARLSTGLDAFLARWEQETLPFLAVGGAELRFVEGPNGRGKTHFLQVLETRAQRAGFVTARVGTQTKPFAALQDTYRQIARAMTVRPIGNHVQPGLAQLLAGLNAEQVRAFRSATRGTPGFRNLLISYINRVQTGEIDAPITQDLRALLMHDTNRRVVFGELFRLDRRLPRPLARLGKRNAAIWLRSLLTLPRQLGYKGLIVLFDETGDDLHLKPEPPRIQQQHMANLRNLVDHLATGGIPACSVVYATTRDLMEIARERYEALWQRVARMDEPGLFEDLPRNPRAVWCRLDEITVPSPAEHEFFLELGGKLLELGHAAGVPQFRLETARDTLPRLSAEMSQNITQGAVRLFIRRMAHEILRTT